MSSLERLAADQRAVLALVLRQGRSYAEIARTLDLAEPAVRTRAHAGVVALADADPGGPAPTPADADLLLGQLAPSEAAWVRAELESAPERATAVRAAGRALTELAPVRQRPEATGASAGEAAPEPVAASGAPVNGATAPSTDKTPVSGAAASSPTAVPPAGLAGGASAGAATVPPLRPAPASASMGAPAPARPGRRVPAWSALRSPGRIALAGLAALVLLGLVLFAAIRDRDAAPAATAAASTGEAAAPTTPTAAPDPRPAPTPAPARTAPRLRDEIRLRAGTAGARRDGLLSLFADAEGNVSYILAGDDLRPTDRGESYVLWLADGGTRPVRLGTAGRVGADGRLSAAGPRSSRGERLLRDLAGYDRVVVSREPSPRTARPDTVVLRGRLPQGD